MFSGNVQLTARVMKPLDESCLTPTSFAVSGLEDQSFYTASGPGP